MIAFGGAEADPRDSFLVSEQAGGAGFMDDGRASGLCLGAQQLIQVRASGGIGDVAVTAHRAPALQLHALGVERERVNGWCPGQRVAQRHPEVSLVQLDGEAAQLLRPVPEGAFAALLDHSRARGVRAPRPRRSSSVFGPMRGVAGEFSSRSRC